LTKNNKSVIIAECAACGKRNSSFLPKSEASKGTGVKETMLSFLPIALASAAAAPPPPKMIVPNGSGLMLPSGGMLTSDEERIIETAISILKSKLGKNGQGIFLASGGVNINKYRKQHQKLLAKIGGVIGIDDIIGIIVGIISLITAIVGAINDAANRAAEAEKLKEEEERRKAEEKKAESEQKVIELQEMLKSYNETLGQLASQAGMPVRDYILEQLKDQTSKVTKMKRTILAKAKEFQMTPPDFVDYCSEMAGRYEWWNVATLLDIMKAEFTNPGSIRNSD
jgi:hypothetical protein